MNEETRKYLRGKSTGGLLVYIENTWGCRISVSVDVLWLGAGQPDAHVSVRVPNAIHRLELNDPPDLQRKTKLGASRDLGPFVNHVIIDWLDSLEAHMDATM